VYYDGKLEGGYFPRLLRNTKAPRWETNNLCLAAMKNARYLKVDACILNQPAKVMVDSGATGNFMHPEFMKKLGLLGKAKAAPQPIADLNGENLGTLTIITESGTVPMVMLGHVE
jgi:predicted aspartyl protease